MSLKKGKSHKTPDTSFPCFRFLKAKWVAKSRSLGLDRLFSPADSPWFCSLFSFRLLMPEVSCSCLRRISSSCCLMRYSSFRHWRNCVVGRGPGMGKE